MSTTRRRIRRTPNYIAFLVTGAIIGFVGGAVFAKVGPDPTYVTYSGAETIGFVGFTFAAIGALVGGVAAALLDRKR